MPQLRLALAQVNTTVGDLAGNADLIVRYTERAASEGAHVVAFPEMALTGYPVEDLALRGSFVAASREAMDALAVRLAEQGLGELVVVCGYLDHDPAAADRVGRPRGSPLDAVAVVHRGRVVVRSAKHHLPNYGVFDEFRYFVPGMTLPVVRIHGVDVAIAVCEDLWQDGGPVAATCAAGADLLLTVNASPYELDKDGTRLALVARRAVEAGCPLAYVNAVGGQDELVFDGDSLVVDTRGNLLARTVQFAEDLLVVDLDLPIAPGGGGAAVPGVAGATAEADGVTATRVTISEDPVPAFPTRTAPMAEPLAEEAEIWRAIVLGTRDYVQKNGMRRVYLGLSGGIDSSVVATVACDAVGADSVYGISNPSVYSTGHSKDDAADLARRTGLHLQVIPIQPLVDEFLSAVHLEGLAGENLQARIRAVIWMGLSNQNPPSIVLACGNKSELATGYSTLYGDAVGGFAPIKDVPKTMVWRLARWRNAEASRCGAVPPIPDRVIEKAPSAELRPGQLDTDSLPPYDVLDVLLDGYVEQDRSAAELVAGGVPVELVDRVIRLVDRAEYKRRQYPPGPKISRRNFGRDRRLPITSAWREPAH